jgi:hypothetical protein
MPVFIAPLRYVGRPTASTREDFQTPLSPAKAVRREQKSFGFK